jgi:hypothetical protein
MKKTIQNFNPLLFLASLGAGGTAVAGFMFIHYGGLFHGKGLATLAKEEQTPLAIFYEIVMIVLSGVHFWLSIKFFKSYFSWK